MLLIGDENDCFYRSFYCSFLKILEEQKHFRGDRGYLGGATVAESQIILFSIDFTVFKETLPCKLSTSELELMVKKCKGIDLPL